MGSTTSIRRMAENESVFREHNERVQQSFEELKKFAEEEGHQDLITEDDMPLYFYCECADENCRERIMIRPSEYDKIHSNRRRFIIVRDHQVAKLEEIVAKKPEYWIVEKFISPPEAPDGLNTTDVDNT